MGVAPFFRRIGKDLGQPANLVIVADHGMATVSKARTIPLDRIANPADYRAIEASTYAALVPVPGHILHQAATAPAALEGFLRMHSVPPGEGLIGTVWQTAQPVSLGDVRDVPELARLRDELRKHVVKEIGALARPDDLRFSDALPKTRSGQIMRRLLRQIASGDETLGDTTTLEDLSVLAKLRDDED